MKNARIGLVSVTALAVASPAGFAQSATLEEVVVTARKRTETLEEAPVSVSAFTADDIAAAGIETPRDFIGLTPNVTLVETQNAGNAFINVRGISQARNSELSVAVLVDGVLMPNPGQFTQQLFDIQQRSVARSRSSRATRARKSRVASRSAPTTAPATRCAAPSAARSATPTC